MSVCVCESMSVCVCVCIEMVCRNNTCTTHNTFGNLISNKSMHVPLHFVFVLCQSMKCQGHGVH